LTPEKLIQHAIKAQERAVAPYSNYLVGAAILTDSKTVILGCNVESKAYPTTLCAERVAIFSAISQGFTNFTALALITKDGAFPAVPAARLSMNMPPIFPFILPMNLENISPGISQNYYHFPLDNG